MSNLGYGFEHFVEDYFMKLAGQKITDPIFTSAGKIGRTFRVPGSGAMSSLDGDVITQLPFLTKQFYIECKHWKQKTKKGLVFRVPMRDLNKNLVESATNEKLPLFMISFKGETKNRIQVIVDRDTMTCMELIFGGHEYPYDSYCEAKSEWFKLGKTLILKKEGLDSLYKSCPKYKINIKNEWYIMSWDYFDEKMQKLAKEWRAKCS